MKPLDLRPLPAAFNKRQKCKSCKCWVDLEKGYYRFGGRFFCVPCGERFCYQLRVK